MPRTDAWWQSLELMCPEHRVPLRPTPGQLTCPRCPLAFRVEQDIPNLLGQGSPPDRWRKAQTYELAFWDREDSRRRGERSEQNRRGAEGLVQLFESHAPQINWRQRALQIGPADEGEIHYLPADERYALEPLALALAERGLLVRSGVHWLAGRGERLPFPNRHFSLILITNVLDHVADPRAVLEEMHRCLKPDGLAWLTCHVVNPLIRPAFRVLHASGRGYFKGHPWCFSGRSLERLCVSAGFRPVWSETRSGAGKLGCSGKLLRRLKPFLLREAQLLLARGTAAGIEHEESRKAGKRKALSLPAFLHSS